MSKKNQSLENLNNEKIAAHTLLEKFVAENPNKIAHVLSSLIAFYGECSQSGLKSAMNTVNVTFASVALDVVKTASLDEGDEGKQYLPVDANEMKISIYYLSKLIKNLDQLSALIENNQSNPAIRLCKNAFSEIEELG